MISNLSVLETVSPGCRKLLAYRYQCWGSPGRGDKAENKGGFCKVIKNIALPIIQSRSIYRVEIYYQTLNVQSITQSAKYSVSFRNEKVTAFSDNILYSRHRVSSELWEGLSVSTLVRICHQRPCKHAVFSGIALALLFEILELFMDIVEVICDGHRK